MHYICRNIRKWRVPITYQTIGSVRLIMHFSLKTGELSSFILGIRIANTISVLNPVAPSVLCLRCKKWSRTRDKNHIWCCCLGSKYFRSLSVHTDTCPLEGSVMNCFLLSVSMDPVLLTCIYLKHLHRKDIWISTVFICTVSLSLIWHTATDTKYAKIIFEQNYSQLPQYIRVCTFISSFGNQVS